jgi:predicted LPLAT superfamily acyltransferase
VNTLEHVEHKSVGWSGQNEGGLRGVRMFTRFVALSGPYIGPVLLAIGTWFAIPFLHVRRAGSEYFFTHLRGRRGNYFRRLWDTYRNFLAFTLCWHERTYAFLRGPGFLRLDIKGEEHMTNALASGKGVVLLTAHIGNFELGAWILAQRHGQDFPPVNMVMIETEVAPVRAFLASIRGARQPKIIAVNSSPMASLPVLAALKRGEIACVQGDRASGSKSAWVPFLGQPAPFPTGPYHLAKLAGAAVIPTLCRRLGRAHYEFQVYPAIDSSNPEASASEYAALLEREVRARPYYWFNLFSFWEASHAPTVRV